MKKFYSLLVLTMLALVLAVGGCNSSDDDGSPVVHVGGTAYPTGYMIAAVWVNSDGPDLLPDDESQSAIEGIFATKDDVYACGSILTGENMRPVYWKNGVRTDLPLNFDIGVDSIATGIVESGGSLHISGGVPALSGSALPAYWKDDELTVLPVLDDFGGGLANAICVSGTTVYLGGFCVANQVAYPTYWVDGTRVELDVPELEGYNLSTGIVSSIAVDGDDLYIVATINYSDEAETGIIRKAVLWKNGEPTTLTALDDDWAAEAYGVAASDGHVYVAGLYFEEGIKNKPCLWTDGELQQLSMIDSDLVGSASGVTVHGGKVYVCGDTTKMKDPDVEPQELYTYACYWVNGERVDLPSAAEAPDSDTVAFDICVTK